ncbi:hypothetical protein AXF42_Ash004034 [Apostasia shenzhenica]|uniref:Sulfotransferase n=1 Tax=Apostasia shenzhenica TaxID=1088818 RepID=A0A2I0A1U7_9ASPA|nr:hypothetical protein AXF42_Ash004034 [Apostasia shenzhenica]
MKGREEELEMAEEYCFSSEVRSPISPFHFEPNKVELSLSRRIKLLILYCSFVANARCQLQATLNTNLRKKSPLMRKMVALSIAVIFSVVVCCAFLKQTEAQRELHVISANLTENSLHHVVRINLTEELIPQQVEIDLTKNSSLRMKEVDSNEETLTENSELTMPREVEDNLTEKSLPDMKKVNLNMGEPILPHAVAVNLRDQTLAPKLIINLTEKALLGVKAPDSPPPYDDYRKLKTDSGLMNSQSPSILAREERICGPGPVSRYAIVSIQRSGSKWFEGMLNNHGNIRSYGEIFYHVEGNRNMTVIREILDRFYSLNWRSPFKRRRRTCIAAVGFKWMLNQASILSSYKPKLNIKRLLSNMDHMERLVIGTRNNFRSTRHMTVYYEDLVQNQTNVMMDVLDFLGMPKRELVSGHVKIHTRPLKEQIENWSAVVKVLKRSKYKKFIADNDYEVQ